MELSPQKPQNETTRVDVKGAGTSVSIVGPAIAVIALIAVLGLIWIGVRLIDLSRHAIDRSPARTAGQNP